MNLNPGSTPLLQPYIQIYELTSALHILDERLSYISHFVQHHVERLFEPQLEKLIEEYKITVVPVSNYKTQHLHVVVGGLGQLPVVVEEECSTNCIKYSVDNHFPSYSDIAGRSIFQFNMLARDEDLFDKAKQISETALEFFKKCLDEAKAKPDPLELEGFIFDEMRVGFLGGRMSPGIYLQDYNPKWPTFKVLHEYAATKMCRKE